MATEETTHGDGGAAGNSRAARDTYGFAAGLGGVVFATVVCLVVGASLAMTGPSESRSDFLKLNDPGGASEGIKESAQLTKPLPDPLRSLIGRDQWLNTPALRHEDLRGKVVLVNFWTYSCINSLRPLPYLRSWAEKYGDRGLVVVGVHTPEFFFERDLARVRTATAELPVGYPVVLDNDYEVWRDFGNQAWPGFYFFDSNGRLRHRVLGEGAYDRSERLIQKLLSEARGAAVSDPVADIVGVGAQAAAAWNELRTPETYAGYVRGSHFSSPGGMKRDASKNYSSPSRLLLNHWSLSGPWTIGGEFASLDGVSGSISLRFHARDLHLVLARPEGSEAIPFRVVIDGAPPGADRGVDIDADGWGLLHQDRMYQLVRQSGRVRERTFEIEFSAPGVRAYTFTFG